MAAKKTGDIEQEPVAEDIPSTDVYETQAYDPRTEHEPGMPKVDADGRKIVKVKADNENGFRYTHEDMLTASDAVFGEEGNENEAKKGWS
jgi:hypothetical protein